MGTKILKNLCLIVKLKRYHFLMTKHTWILCSYVILSYFSHFHSEPEISCHMQELFLFLSLLTGNWDLCIWDRRSPTVWQIHWVELLDKGAALDRVSSTQLDKPSLTKKVFWPYSATAVFFPIVFISHKCFWAPITTFVQNLKTTARSLNPYICFLFQKTLAEVAKWCEVIFQDDSSTWRKFRLWL